MRCLACNDALNDQESTRKSAITGEYYDLCNTCFDSIKDQVVPLQITDEEVGSSNEEEDED